MRLMCCAARLTSLRFVCFLTDAPGVQLYTLSLHDALPISLIVGDEPFLFTHRARHTGLAADNRLRSMYRRSECFKDGGLMSYGLRQDATVHDFFTSSLISGRPGLA